MGGKPDPVNFDIFTYPDCIEKFQTKIERLPKVFQNWKSKFQIKWNPTKKQTFVFGFATKSLNIRTIIFLIIATSRDNFSDKHKESKLKQRLLHYTTAFSRNMMNYKLHHIVKTWHSVSEKAKVDLIPKKH